MILTRDRKTKKDCWNEGARKDAAYYIAFRKDKKEWNKEEFFSSGATQVKAFTTRFFATMHFDPQGKKVLDIGCGIGRMTRAFSDIFGEAHGVDFSDEMIKRARILNKDKSNLYFNVNDGVDLAMYKNNFFDFCFSYITFQYVSDPSIIRKYIGEIDRVLKPNGLFKFQVDGRKWGLFRKWDLSILMHRSIYNFLLRKELIDYMPIFFLARDKTMMKALLGCWLSRLQLEKMFEDTTLKITEITGENTQYMWCSGIKDE